VVPDHALPMEGATVGSDAASNGSGDLFVGPRADSCSHVTSEVATPCFLRKSKLVAIPLKPGQQLERRTSISRSGSAMELKFARNLRQLSTE
jgi:hypothetical protein